MKRPVLSHRLVLEAPERVPDGAGGYLTEWVVLGTHWAELKSGTGRVHAVEDRPTATQRWTITMRAAAPGSSGRPMPGQRLRASDRLFAIRSVAEADAEGRYLRCLAEEERVT